MSRSGSDQRAGRRRTGVSSVRSGGQSGREERVTTACWWSSSVCGVCGVCGWRDPAGSGWLDFSALPSLTGKQQARKPERREKPGGSSRLKLANGAGRLAEVRRRCCALELRGRCAVGVGQTSARLVVSLVDCSASTAGLPAPARQPTSASASPAPDERKTHALGARRKPTGAAQANSGRGWSTGLLAPDVISVRESARNLVVCQAP